MWCDKVGNYVLLSTHQRNEWLGSVYVYAQACGKESSCEAGPGCRLGADLGAWLILWSPVLKRNEAIRLIYIWELKWNVSGLSLMFLCLVFMETCVYGKTLSMLGTDRCFCSLSVIMLRMFLLGDELPFFFPFTQMQKIEKIINTSKIQRSLWR